MRMSKRDLDLAVERMKNHMLRIVIGAIGLNVAIMFGLPKALLPS